MVFEHQLNYESALDVACMLQIQFPGAYLPINELLVYYIHIIAIDT